MHVKTVCVSVCLPVLVWLTALACDTHETLCRCTLPKDCADVPETPAVKPPPGGDSEAPGEQADGAATDGGERESLIATTGSRGGRRPASAAGEEAARLRAENDELREQLEVARLREENEALRRQLEAKKQRD